MFNIYIVLGLCLSSFLKHFSIFDKITTTKEVKSLKEITAVEYQSNYQHASHRLILLVDEGVLKPIGLENAEQEHVMSRALLAALTADPKNEVWVFITKNDSRLSNWYRDISNLNTVQQLESEIVIPVGSALPPAFHELSDQTRRLSRDVLEEATSASLLSLFRHLHCEKLRKKDFTFFHKHPSFNAEEGYSEGDFEIDVGSIVFHHGRSTSSGAINVVKKMTEIGLRNPSYYFTAYNEFAILNHFKSNMNVLIGSLLQNHRMEGFFGISIGRHSQHEPIHEQMNSHPYQTKVSVIVSELPTQRTVAKKMSPDYHAVHRFFQELLG